MFELLATYVHDIDPYAIKLWEGGPVRWYGLAYLAGFFVAWLLLRRVLRVGRTTMPVAWATDLVVILAVGALAGGRIGYCAFYEPSLFTSFDASQPPYWGLLAMNRGGMASHGGIIGAILAAGWFAWRHKQSWLHVLDLTAFGAPIGLMFGRLANFVNGELFGRPCDPDFPLAVQFPQELALGGDLASSDARDAYVDQGLTIPEHADWMWPAEQVQHGDHEMARALETVLTHRHPSQLYAACSEGLIVMLVLLWVWRHPQRPGNVGAWFCVTYAAMRIGNEFFRLPDDQFIAADGTLPQVTRGQWLSLGVMALGVIVLAFNARRKVGSFGSWRRGAWTDELEKLPVDPPAKSSAKSTDDQAHAEDQDADATRQNGGHVRRGRANQPSSKPHVRRGAKLKRTKPGRARKRR